MAQVIWTNPALDELGSLAEYIALDNATAASNLVCRVFSHVELLARQPELGRGIPELRPNIRYRQLVEPPCRIFYRYDKRAGKVVVLGGMRGEKLFQKQLLSQRSKRAKSE